jgi:hypothetical protein
MSSSIPSDARRLGLASALALAFALGSVPASADEDPKKTPAPVPASDPELDKLRESFRTGMEKYRAGGYAEAILIWGKIYDEIGPEKGYLLAFNLARAYEQSGDDRRAGDHYEAYLDEIARRRSRGETLEPLVEKQEGEARARLDATRGQIEITPRADGSPVEVRIDDRTRPAGFVKYVTPGRVHVVVFAPGTRDETRSEVKVAIGERLTLTPPPERPAPEPERTVPKKTREERPYSATYVYVGAGVTALSVLLPVVLHLRALGIKDDYDDANTGIAEARAKQLRTDYFAAGDAAYASIAVPTVLGAATLGLAAFWLWGTKTVEVPVNAGLVNGGATAAVNGRF